MGQQAHQKAIPINRHLVGNSADITFALLNAIFAVIHLICVIHKYKLDSDVKC